MSLSLVLSQAVLGDEAWVLLCSHSKSHVEQSGKIHAKFLNPATSLSTDKCAQALSTVTTKKKQKKTHDFTGSPVVKTLCFQCRGPWLDCWLGNKDPTCHGAQQKKKTKHNKPSYLKGPFTLPDWVYHFVSFCYLIASNVKVTRMHCKLKYILIHSFRCFGPSKKTKVVDNTFMYNKIVLSILAVLNTFPKCIALNVYH